MKQWVAGLAVLVAAVVTVGCGAAKEAAAPAQEESGAGSQAEAFTSEVLGTDYEGTLTASTQLALGSLMLADTDESITPEQAKSLLPLWLALQGEGVTATSEINAVLKQIEGAMSAEQLAKIAAMDLTRDSMQDWMQERGIEIGGGPSGRGGQAGQLTDEERGTRQAELAEGGGNFGRGQGGGDGEIPPEMAAPGAEFANMSEEELAALRATMEAGGGPTGAGGRPEGAGGFSGGEREYMILLQPLVEMLEELAGS